MKRLIEVMQGRFPLQSQLVEGIETIEGERSLRSVEGCRKPTSTQELGPPMNESIRAAITEVNCQAMNACRVDQTKNLRSGNRGGARQATVTQLYSQANLFQRRLFEKLTIPTLQHNDIIYWSERYQMEQTSIR